MRMDVVAGSHNDEWYTPAYAIAPILKYLKPNTVVWCPFDTEESNYVKLLKENGFCVIHGSIVTGQDFFNQPVPVCDYVVSNPPYSLKYECLQRLFDIGKPFAMLVGVVGLFENKKKFDMFKNNEFEIMYFNKRISFLTSYTETKPKKHPPFSSVYVCHNILPKQIMFEEL